MTPTKPAARYIANAVSSPDRSAWFAQFGAPGMVPAFVLDGERPQRFNTRGSAEVAAMRALIETLNAKPLTKFNDKREFMSGMLFAEAVQDIGITITQAALLVGTRPERAIEMVNEQRQVPFAMWWALPLLRDRRLLDFALQEAARHTDFQNEDRVQHMVEAPPR